MARSHYDARDPRSAPPPAPLGDQVRAFLERLAEHGMTQVAAGGIVIGIILHVAVLYAVLGESHPHKDSTITRPVPAAGSSQPASTAGATATPDPKADRHDCAAIRGTDYRSDTERQWFQTNCS